MNSRQPISYQIPISRSYLRGSEGKPATTRKNVLPLTLDFTHFLAALSANSKGESLEALLGNLGTALVAVAETTFV